MELSIYYDFTCGYSYRTWLWIEELQATGIRLEVDWRPFVLKEVNRDGSDPSLLSGPAIDSVAVLALAGAEAIRGRPSADHYRSEMFHAMHAGDERPDRDGVIAVAAHAGLDAGAFWTDQETWLGAVRESHERAISGWGVFGTPTLVFSDEDAMYLKLATVPSDGGKELWAALRTVTTGGPEVLELKRPQIESS